MGMSEGRWKRILISFLAKKHQYGGHDHLMGEKREEEREKKIEIYW